MDATDPDYAAFVDRLPVLRRYEEVIRTRLHHWAIRDPERRGSALADLALYFREGVSNRITPVNRALLKRMVAFAPRPNAGRFAQGWPACGPLIPASAGTGAFGGAAVTA